ncbi:MAG TPA: DUF4168 domain-containing protein [Burkholderiales bacterium]|nr:DUF4168 domain-containing protein [Burkholderiales bacterium]
MKIRSDILLAAMVALLSAPVSMPASATLSRVAMAPDGAEPQSQQLEQDEAAFSDDELKTFVVAVIEVQRINQNYLNRVNTATTKEEQDGMLQSAADEMTEVVQKNGMTVDRFTEILNHAQMNPQLASRVRKHMHDLR